MSKKKKKKKPASVSGDTAEFKVKGGSVSIGGRGETKKIAEIAELRGEGKRMVSEDGEVRDRPEIEDPVVDYPPEPEWDEIPAEAQSVSQTEPEPQEQADIDDVLDAVIDADEEIGSDIDDAAGEKAAEDDIAPIGRSAGEYDILAEIADEEEEDVKIFGSPVKEKNDGPIKRLWDRIRLIVANHTLTTAAVKFLLVAVGVVVLIALWGNRYTLGSNMTRCADSAAMSGSGGGFPVTLTGGRSTAIEEMSGGIAALTDNTFSLYNLGGREIASRSHFMSAPVMKTAGRYALLMDIGNKSFRLETAAKTLCAENTDGRVIAGAVARSGRFVVVTQASENTSLSYIFRIYDKKSVKWEHSWKGSSCYITDIALSTNGKYFAVCGVNAEDGILTSHVVIQKTGEKEPIADIERHDNMLIALKYTSAGTLIAVGDKGIMIIDDDGAVATDIALDGELLSFDIDSDYGAAMCTESVNGMSTLTMFDIRGRQKFSEKVPLYGVSVEVSPNGCTILGRDELRTYRSNGSMSGSFRTNAASTDVLTLDGSSFVLDGLKVSRYN